MKAHYDVVIVGAGPAGIFCALTLAEQNESMSIALIDKGNLVSKRTCPRSKNGGICIDCAVCNITTGFGGAGAFSDGKLTYSDQVGGWLTDIISKETLYEYYEFVDKIWSMNLIDSEIFEFNDEELAQNCQRAGLKLIPSRVRHLGTDRTTEIIQTLFTTLNAKPNVDILTRTSANTVLHQGKRVTGLTVFSEGASKTIATNNVVLVPGRAGSEWLKTIVESLNIKTTANPVDIGVRVETAAIWADKMTEKLYDPKIVYYTASFDDKIRTFCVNPRGEVVTESYGDVITVNGHSNHDSKTNNTNFALLVSTQFTEPFHHPTEYGKSISRLSNMISGGGVIVQRFGDLKKGRRTTKSRLEKSSIVPTLAAVPGDLSFVLPHRYIVDIIEMIDKLDEVSPGIANKDTLLYGVEVKFYSSRPELESGFETKIKGLYVGGDGAGITRGLTQASVNGIIIAQQILDG